MIILTFNMSKLCRLREWYDEMKVKRFSLSCSSTGPSLDSYKCFPNSTLKDAESGEIINKI